MDIVLETSLKNQNTVNPSKILYWDYMCAVQRDSGWFLLCCAVTCINFQSLGENPGHEKLEIELLTFEAVSVNFILGCAVLDPSQKTIYRNTM